MMEKWNESISVNVELVCACSERCVNTKQRSQAYMLAKLCAAQKLSFTLLVSLRIVATHSVTVAAVGVCVSVCEWVSECVHLNARLYTSKIPLVISIIEYTSRSLVVFFYDLCVCVCVWVCEHNWNVVVVAVFGGERESEIFHSVYFGASINFAPIDGR